MFRGKFETKTVTHREIFFHLPIYNISLMPGDAV